MDGGGFTFREITEKEARLAVLLGHNLILRLLKLQNEYFALDLDAEIKARFEIFPKIWDSIPPIDDTRVDVPPRAVT